MKSMVIMQPEKVREPLLAWYGKNHRRLPWRETHDPYRIWVSEVMLQQTQVNTVLHYYRRFIKRFPTIRRLAGSDLQQVLKAWEGMGYYARARNLHRAAGIVDSAYGGRIPDDYAVFRSLPGVGDYIAPAVLSIAFGRAYAVVDGNVKRVLARLLCMDNPVNSPVSARVFKRAAQDFLDDRQPGTFNQAVMELGALVCRPRNPSCRQCPLNPFCLAFRHEAVEGYPKRIRAKPTPLHRQTAGVVFRNGKVLITRRKPEGLLGGLWEFPGGEVQAGEAPSAACRRSMRETVNLAVEIGEHLTQVKHAYTHFRLTLDVFRCRYVSGRVRLNGAADFRWIRPKDVDRYPFPKANLKFIPLLLTA